MMIPEKLRTVTPLSKNIALALVILLPFLGFIFGMRYQKSIAVPEYIEANRCPILREEELPKSSEESEILSSTIVDCVLYADLRSGERVRVAALNDLGLKNKDCLTDAKGRVSNYGDYLAFEDISGGVDSMLRVYSVDLDRTTTLGVYGTSMIRDFVFMPGDVLVVLTGYPGTPEEHWLKAYDIKGLHENYDDTVNPEFLYFTQTTGYEKDLPLTNFGEDYTHLRVSTESVVAHTKDPEKYVVFSPEDYSF